MSSWSEVTVGRERAVTQSDGEVQYLFTFGPPHRVGSAASRVRDLVAALGPAVRAARWGTQVHGADVATVGRVRATASSVGAVDALVTGETGVALLAWGADCVTVLLGNQVAVGAAHAGWRGAAAGVVTATVRELERRFGVTPASLHAGLGPSIGPCHYPVGPEVIAALAARGIPERLWRQDNRVDLRAFLRAELERLGVTLVELVGGCTACDPGLASYRRDGHRAGRQLAAIVRRAGSGERQAASGKRLRHPGPRLILGATR